MADGDFELPDGTSLDFGGSVFDVIKAIIEEVVNNANGAYSTALTLLDNIANINNGSGLNSALTVAAIPPVKPLPIEIESVDTDVTLDTTPDPATLTLGNVDTSLAVGDVTAPTLMVGLPPIPVPPTFSDVPAPDLSFNYTEAMYASVLKDAIYNALLSEVINGSTGLTAAVETDIYARESERDLLELQNTRDRVATLWAESGMSLPDGVLVSALTAVEIEYQNKYSDKSRDVRVESFKRADDNAKFVKDLSVKFENVLMDYTGQYWERQLKAAGALLGYAQAVYETLIKYQALFLEKYKAETEGYKATAQALTSVLDAEVKAYDSEVKYEIGKAEILSKSAGLEIDLQKNQIQKGQLDVSVFDSKTKFNLGKADIESKSIALKIDSLKQIVERYQAETQMYDTEGRFNIGAATVTIQSFGAQIELLKAQLSAAVSASSNIAHVASTLAAGAMSAVSAHASLSASESQSDSSNRSAAISTNYNHNISE